MAYPSAQRRLDVLIGDTLVGHLRCTLDGRREHASFEYAAEWLGLPTRNAIDPTLPLVSGPHCAPRVTDLNASKFHGAIADTEPHG